MASKRHGVRTCEWHKHLRKRTGTKRAQENVLRTESRLMVNPRGLHRDWEDPGSIY